MKYMVFGAVLVLGVPAMTIAALYSEKIKSWLLTALVFSTVLGDRGNINFMSMEAYRGPDRGFEMTVTEMFAMALMAVMLIRNTRQLKWIPYNALPLFLYLAVALFSVVDAPEPILAWFTLFKMVRTGLLYWCVVNCIRTGIPVRAVWRGLIGIAVVVIAQVLQQKYLGGIYRVTAGFDHSNTLAMYLNMISAMLLAFGLTDKTLSTGRALVTIIAALGLLLATVMTFSRAGMALGAFAAMGVLAFANLRSRSMRVAIATVVAFAGITAGAALSLPSIIDRIMEAPPTSAGARDEYNLSAKLMLQANPMGVGINQFSHVMTNNKEYRRHIKVMANEKQAGVCHHVYWLTAAELGWLGLALFMVIIVRFAWRALWYAWRSPGRDGALQAALFLGMVATHASGFLEWVLRITPLFFTYALCAGISVGLAELEKQRRSTLHRPAADPGT